MQDAEIVARTHQVFKDTFELSEERLVPQARVFEDLGLDSLDVVDMIVALQQQFGISIRDDQRIRSIRTLQDIYDFIGAVTREAASRGDGA
jgi:acyl carrier protein